MIGKIKINEAGYNGKTFVETLSSIKGKRICLSVINGSTTTTLIEVWEDYIEIEGARRSLVPIKHITEVELLN